MDTKYTKKNIIIISSIFIITYFYALIYAPSIENEINNDMTKLNKSCLIHCKTNFCKKHIKNNRGDKYFISTPIDEQENIKNCLLTFWGFSHFIMYFVLSYLVPEFYVEFIIIGILFEIYEYCKFECHDGIDIFLNIAGVVLGKYVSTLSY